MQYELRTQVIETTRKTFDNIVARNGDRLATRYEEGTLDLQPTENFHYRPTWDPEHEIYDEGFSALRLTDPYSFTDPRQYYYTPYVAGRASSYDAFAGTMDYLEKRDLLSKLDPAWSGVVAGLIVPLRHYESAAQMVSSAAARFGYGASITQCAAYASFDRVGNAQLISRLGIALAGGGADGLDAAKIAWMEDEALQGLRRRAEEIMVVKDWAAGMLALDVCDRLVYSIAYTDLDEAALLGGAGSYSLVAQHLAAWFTDQRKWVDALIRTWRADPEHGENNARLIAETVTAATESAVAALTPWAARIDQSIGTRTSAALVERAASITGELE